MSSARRRRTRIETPPPRTARRGRRHSSSREAIEEAAGELFLENTYARTTIEQITARAGVSRTSFFNYFDAKSDLLWGDVDEVIDDIAARLASASAGPAVSSGIGSSAIGSSATGHSSSGESPMTMVCSVVVAAASGIPAGRIPLAVTQWDVMGVRSELLAAGLSRFDRLASVVRRFLAARCMSADDVQIAAAALALVGAAAAGAAHWASAGTARGDLSRILDGAVAPVCTGFADQIH